MRTRKTIGIIIGAAALLLSAGVAFAEESGTNADASAAVTAQRPTAVPAIRPEVKKAAQERVQDIRKEAQTRVEAVRENAKDLMEAKREEAKNLMETKREETKNLIEARREEAKKLMEAKREEAKKLIETKREEMKVRVEELRGKAEKRLADIKDKAKQEAAQRLAKQLSELNATWTDRFVQTLDRYTTVLGKIQDRANIAADAGKDVTAATAAIQSANTAIETARTAVIAQAAKTYVLDTSTLTTATEKGQSELMKNVKASFQSLHKSLFKDLFAVRDGAMTDARKAVQDALATLGKIPGVNEGSSATSTAATSNQ